MVIVECGCARHKRGFRSIFVNGKFDRTEKGEPPPPSLRDKLRGVLEKPAPVQCADLDLNAIRCAWCGDGAYLCSCGIMTCTGAREGLIYTCMCGLRGTLKEMPDDAVVRGGAASASTLLAAPKRLLIGRSK